MKVKHELEFLVCFFSGHDFLVAPEYAQHAKCRYCDKPYAATLKDRLPRRKDKLIQSPIETPTEKILVVSGMRKR